MCRKIEYSKGQMFGDAEFMYEVPSKTKSKFARFGHFKCQCGNEFEAQIALLKRGEVKGCGCRMGLSKHGMRNTPTWKAWGSMNERCNCESNLNYYNYGGRGIKICDRWAGENGFQNFFEDMGERPSKDYSLDRIDVNGNYEPSNCRWATIDEQANNKRNSSYVELNGKIQTMSQWCKELNLCRTTILNRIQRGMTAQEALTKPIDIKCRNNYPITNTKIT